MSGKRAADQPHPEMIASIADRDHAAAALIVRATDCRRDVARRVVQQLGGLASAMMAGELELSRCGMTTAQVGRMRACGELAREYRAFHENGREHAMLPSDVYLLLRREGITYAEQETFCVISLNVRNGILGCTRVHVGTVHGVEVHPREVFRAAIRLNAAAVVLAHNHPSGDHAPSLEDIELTRRQRAVGEILGVHVIDHVVVSSNGFTSIAELRPELFA